MNNLNFNVLEYIKILGYFQIIHYILTMLLFFIHFIEIILPILKWNREIVIFRTSKTLRVFSLAKQQFVSY